MTNDNSSLESASRKTHVSSKQKSKMSQKLTCDAKRRLETSCGVSDPVMDRALEIQATLSPEIPTFVRQMLKSHVTGGFWLGLDKEFCVSHMPKVDAAMILVDENEMEYRTQYLSLASHGKFALSGGWKKFAEEKRLEVGDVAIFQLVEPRKFKVYIIRAETNELDGAASLQNLNSNAKPMETAGGSKCNVETEKQKCEDPLWQHNRALQYTLKLISNYDPTMDEFDHDNDTDMTSGKESDLDVVISDQDPVTGVFDPNNDNDMTSCEEGLDGVISNDDAATDVLDPDNDTNMTSYVENLDDISFGDVKSFDDFKIQVGVKNFNSEFPMHIRQKYYKLCFSQNMFLHKNLINQNRDLVVGVIFETVNMADAIKEVKSAKKSDLENWERTLKSFASLGMEVGFLLDTISALLCWI